MQFTYELTGIGWSQCRLETAKGSIITTASYLDDALGDLCEAILSINNGSEYSRAIFTEEPGEFRWVFKRIDSKTVNLQILWYDDLWLNKPDKDGKILFEDNLLIIEFMKAFVNGITTLLNQYTLEEYYEKWVEYEFPKETFKKIKDKVG